MINLKLSGRFKLVIGGQSLPWQENLIVDSGLDLLGTTNNVRDCMTTCQVGTGTTPPAAGQTALDSPLATSTGITATSDEASRISPYWVGVRRKFSFGTLSGDITEVGVFGTAMFSRAVLPEPVTILSGETLSVIYEFRLYIEESDVPWSATFDDGISRSGVIRPGRIDEIVLNGFLHNGGSLATDGALSPITEAPTGTPATGGLELQPYTPGNFYRDVKLSFGETQGNQSISALYTEPSVNGKEVPCYQVSIDPPIPKTNNDVFDWTFRFSWSNR